MKKKMKVLLGLLFVTMLSAFASNAYAQVWKGNALENVLASSKSDTEKPIVTEADRKNTKKTVFLYNPATGLFLNQGGSWGTHSIGNDVGIRCWILKTQVTEGETVVERYHVETACKNSQHANKGDYLGFGGNEPYLDNSDFAEWMIEPVSDRSLEYYIHSTQASDKADRYLFVTLDNKKVNADPIESENLKGNEDRAKWMFVTEQDLIDQFNKTTVELGGVPADATFLLGDADFYRYSNEQEQWDWTSGSNGSSAELYVGINKHFQKYNVETQQYEWIVSGDTKGEDAKNGQYWSARILGGTGCLSQTLTVKKSGWYRVQCQGEYYAPGVTTNSVASLFAQTDAVKIKSPLRLTTQKIGEFSTTRAGYNSEGQRYDEHFGDYTNTLMIYVDCGEDNSKTVNLKLGITVEGDNVSSETGVAVDAFRLQYCGVPDGHDLVLDEDFKDFDYITKESGDKQYKNSILYLHRSLKKNCWNTIILPVNLTAQQFDDTFGVEAKLARYNGVRNNRLQFLVQDDKSVYDTEEKGAFLKANIPYIIWPAIEAEHTAPYSYKTTSDEDTSTRDLKTYEVKVGTPYYVVNNVSMDKENVNQIVVSGTETAGTLKDGYAFNGIFVQDYEGRTFLDVAHALAGDYTFNQGKLHCFKSDYGMKGFRCWFHAVDGEMSQAKQMEFDINGVSGDEVTGVDIPWTNEVKGKFADIYTINGQKVNAQRLEDLPRGVYIVNQKKYVVR